MARNFPSSAQYGHRVRAFALIAEPLRPSSESSVMCHISSGSFGLLLLVSRRCLPSSSKALLSSLESARTFSLHRVITGGNGLPIWCGLVAYPRGTELSCEGVLYI